MRGGQHPQPGKRTRGRGERLGVTVTDLDDLHQRPFGELSALRVVGPLLGGTDDGEDDASSGGRLVEFLTVPFGYRLGEAFLVRRALQEIGHTAEHARVGTRQQAESTAPGPLKVAI